MNPKAFVQPFNGLLGKDKHSCTPIVDRLQLYLNANTHSCMSKVSFPLLSFSAQPPPAYSHPSTASYSVQQAPAVAHAVTASYTAAPVQAARPVVTAPYPTYQSHQAPPDYAYRQPDPPAPPQPTTTPQTYQVYPETVRRHYRSLRKCQFDTQGL